MSTGTSRSSSISYPPPYQDAVRIFVQHQGLGDNGGGGGVAGGNTPSSRRFSVDPQLTSFAILRNLIGRAFDMKGDFGISYRAFDDFGGETYLPLVSDWDLSAAFHSASDPDLQLQIESKGPVGSDDEEEPWDLIRSCELISDASPLSHRIIKQSSLHSTQSNGSNGTLYAPKHGSRDSSANATPTATSSTASLHSGQGSHQGGTSSKVFSAMSQLGGAVNQYPLALNTKINTAGLFNTMEKWVQKAKTFVEDLSVVTSRPPLSDVEFRHYLDGGGLLTRPRELRYACYHGGVEGGLRKVVWKHLLNIYPDALSGNARMEYVRSKSREYYELRDVWKGSTSAHLSEEIQCVSNMVRKDVLRTDRHLPFYAGQDDNQNINILFNILTTYALNHPSVGYCQGMSDLASPLLFTMGDEAQAYLCFCALMDRLKPNFSIDGVAMSLKFAHLSEALSYYDQEFWTYLLSIGADDLLFCYRWLLLELKREFAFEDALRMMEVLWASLPYKPQDVPLHEEGLKFTLDPSTTSTLPQGPLQRPLPPLAHSLNASYSKVAAIRRGSSITDVRSRRQSRKPKVNPLSLDESALVHTGSGGGSGAGSVPIPATAIPRAHAKPFYSLDETVEAPTTSSLELSSSPFEILSTNLGKPKLVKNLKEFWTIGKSLEDSQPSSPFSSKSSTISNFQDEADELNGGVFYENLTPPKTTPPTKVTTPPKTTPPKYISPIRQELEESTPPPPPLNTGGVRADRDSENDSGHCYGDSMEYGDEEYLSRAYQKEPKEAIEFDSFSGGSLSLDSSGELDPLIKGKIALPESLGGGNPFLMFLCLTLLLQHREHILKNQLDYNETAMYFDKLIRKHNVGRVLAHARMLYSQYLKHNGTSRA